MSAHLLLLYVRVCGILHLGGNSRIVAGCFYSTKKTQESIKMCFALQSVDFQRNMLRCSLLTHDQEKDHTIMLSYCMLLNHVPL